MGRNLGPLFRGRSLEVGVVGDSDGAARLDGRLASLAHWTWVRIGEGNRLEIKASHSHWLYGWWRWVAEHEEAFSHEELAKGVVRQPTFSIHRPQYDLFLTQHARMVRNFNEEAYIRDLARMGHTHVEVNGLAFPDPIETGPKGEVLHRFYTYCAALDQFVTSRLNKGIYPASYLKANLAALKRRATLAEKYGLRPGIACYEPRSVPESFFRKYPTLRGARVDHPFRSFKPRFNMSTGHPVVLEHYAELMKNLMKEVPALDYMAIYSNDSGAGFEYTHSLYAGRNGGGYVIREWKGEGEIAEAAAKNLVRYHKVLKDAARTVNPGFRVMLRFEAFWTEHEYIWRELEDGIDVEVSSLQTKGWDLVYQHPTYPDVPQIHGTALFSQFDAKERPAMEALRQKGVETHVLYTSGVLWNHEPLIGLPFPWLVYEKLNNMHAQGVTAAAHMGAATPSAFAPYNINQEIVRAFQWDAGINLDQELFRLAKRWVGEEAAPDLVNVWRCTDEAFRRFPIPVWIYAAWNVWYRLAIRPLVPNIEAISERERAYYERYLLATSHNRARVDLKYDVGFDLVDPAFARKAVERMDKDLFPKWQEALERADFLRKSQDPVVKRCGIDLYDRLRAMKCWWITQRNVAAWIAGVHGYLGSDDPMVKQDCRALLRGMVLSEIANTKDLLDLWKTSKTTWMIVSKSGERTFIYGKNFGDHLKKKIKLMSGRQDDEPYIDQEFQWRVPGFTNGKLGKGGKISNKGRSKKS